MEVKIFCGCGSKYKFDVEPLNGKLPGPVSCPVCGADGTQKGNEIIAQTLGISAPPAPAAPVVASVVAAPQNESGPRIAIPVMPKPAGAVAISIPTAPAPQASPQPVASVASSSGTTIPEVPRSSKAGFVAPTVPRSSKQVAASAPIPTAAPVAPVPVPIPVAAAPQASAAVAPAVRAVTPSAVSTRLSVGTVHTPAPAAAPAEPQGPFAASPMPMNQKPPKEPSFMRGLVGIGVASFVGLLLWFGVTSFLLGFMKYLGIGLGAMIGWTGAWLGQHKSQKLGIAAGIATALTLMVGTLWVARHEGLVYADEELKRMYEEKVAYAKEAVKAKTDEEILKVMDQEPQMELDEDSDSAEEGLTKVVAKAQQTDAQRIAEWKKKELPQLRKFAEGKVSRLQFEKDMRPMMENLYGLASLISRVFRKSMIICFVVAVGAAFKISSS